MKYLTDNNPQLCILTHIHRWEKSMADHLTHTHTYRQKGSEECSLWVFKFFYSTHCQLFFGEKIRPQHFEKERKQQTNLKFFSMCGLGCLKVVLHLTGGQILSTNTEVTFNTVPYSMSLSTAPHSMPLLVLCHTLYDLVLLTLNVT